MEITEIKLLELRAEVREKVYANEYCTDRDGDTIFYAKEIARKNKISFKDILKGMRPCGSINRPLWDDTGKIVPYKRIFY
jgi:tartrate dehydratase alpha subunit/fumarate hydratase class I-like protein